MLTICLTVSYFNTIMMGWIAKKTSKIYFVKPLKTMVSRMYQTHLPRQFITWWSTASTGPTQHINYIYIVIILTILMEIPLSKCGRSNPNCYQVHYREPILSISKKIEHALVRQYSTIIHPVCRIPRLCPTMQLTTDISLKHQGNGGTENIDRLLSN